MKRFVTLLASLVVLVCGALPALADDGGYTITNYQVEAVLYEDNTVHQTETIDVEFSEYRHGIYRSIPQSMIVGRIVDGEAVEMEYRNKVQDISVEGAPYETSDDGSYMNIQIGDEDETVIGSQRYVITFTYSMPDDRLEDGDFLFYSLLGSDWGTTIKHFSFEMTFDKELPEEVLADFAVYSGSYGATENELGVEYLLDRTMISGEASDIAAYESITLFADLSEGYFVGARTTSAIPAGICAGIAILLGVFVVFRALRTKNRKPVQTVEFYPPDGISSAEVGYIIDNTADDGDLLSLIPWWAEKGYLTIEECPDKKGRRGKHSKLILHKTRDLPQDAPHYMQELFDGFFKGGETCKLSDLDKTFAESLHTSCSLLGDEFVGTKQLYTSKALPLVLMALTSVALGGMLLVSNAISLEKTIIQAVIAALICMVLGFFLWNQRFSTNFSGRKQRIAGVVVPVAALLAVGAAVASCMENNVLPAPVLWAAYAATAAACLLGSRMTQPTPYNVEISGKLMGLRHFIETAEMPRLKLLLEENPSYYYDILPYAMVFGLTDQWAEQFRELSVMQPTWYMGADPMFDIWYFNSMMYTGVQKPIEHVQADAARAAAQNSTSFGGGGGFAGGGGGGGGGGSW